MITQDNDSKWKNVQKESSRSKNKNKQINPCWSAAFVLFWGMLFIVASCLLVQSLVQVQKQISLHLTRAKRGFLCKVLNIPDAFTALNLSWCKFKTASIPCNT